MTGAARVHAYSNQHAHDATPLTHTDVQPPSASTVCRDTVPLRLHPLNSIARYMHARAKYARKKSGMVKDCKLVVDAKVSGTAVRSAKAKVGKLTSLFALDSIDDLK